LLITQSACLTGSHYTKVNRERKLFFT